MLWTHSNLEAASGSNLFTCAAMCTARVNIQSFPNWALHDWSRLRLPEKHTGHTKSRSSGAGTRLSVAWGCAGSARVVPSPLCLCAVLRAARLLAAQCIGGGGGGQVDHDQPGKRGAGRYQPHASAGLTSHLLAPTHSLFSLKAGVIPLCAGFTQEDSFSQVCALLYVCRGEITPGKAVHN